MNKYRVYINNFDMGLFEARNIDEAQGKALQKWIDEGKQETPYSYVIKREG